MLDTKGRAFVRPRSEGFIMQGATSNSRACLVRSRWIRPAVDIAMALVYVLQMVPHQTGGWYHELAGIAFAVLLVVHHALNARWLRAELRRRDWLPIALDVALLACVVGMAVSGMLMARHVRLLRLEGVAHATRPLHACLTYVGLMLMALHAGMHLPRRALDRLPAVAKVVGAAVVVGLGCYAFIRLDAPTKLTLGMSFPDGVTPLPMLVARHVLLAGPFVLLGVVIAHKRERRVRK